MPDETTTTDDHDDCLTPAERAALQGLVDANHWPTGTDHNYPHGERDRRMDLCPPCS